MRTTRILGAVTRFLGVAVVATAGCTSSPITTEGQDAPFAMLAFLPDGALLAAARRSGNAVVLLDPGTLQSRREFRGAMPMPVRSVGFSRDGARLAAAGIDDTVVAWEVATGRELFRRSELKGARQAVLSPDGTLVAIAGPGREASVWRIDDQREIARLKGHFDEVLAVAFSHRGDLVATGSADRTVRLWTLERPTPETLPEWHPAPVTGLTFSPDDAWLAATGGGLTLWRVADRRSVAHALEPAPVPGIPKATQDAIRILLMIFASAGTMAHGGAPVYIGPGGDMSPTAPLVGDLPVAFSPDGRLLAAIRIAPGAWRANEVVIAEIAGTRLTRFSCDCTAIAFRPDGAVLATAGREIRFWDPRTGEPAGR